LEEDKEDLQEYEKNFNRQIVLNAVHSKSNSDSVIFHESTWRFSFVAERRSITPPNRGIKLTSHRPNMQTTKKEKDYASFLINKARRNLLWSNMLEMVTRRIII